jgi:predicted site-specific integrase-resolvase
MSNQQGTRFYKPEEAAAILQIPRADLMQLIKRRELHAIRLSARTIRVTDNQLAWFQYRHSVPTRSTVTARLSTKSGRKERR